MEGMLLDTGSDMPSAPAAEAGGWRLGLGSHSLISTNPRGTTAGPQFLLLQSLHELKHPSPWEPELSWPLGMEHDPTKLMLTILSTRVRWGLWGMMS